MMVRGTLRYQGSLGALVRALTPFLLAQMAGAGNRAAVSAVTHLARTPPTAPALRAPVSSDEINRRLRTCSTPIPDEPIDLGPPK